MGIVMKSVGALFIYALVLTSSFALGEVDSDPPSHFVRSLDEFDHKVELVSWAAQKVLPDMRLSVEWVSAGGDSIVFVPLEKKKLFGLGNHPSQSPDSFWGEDTGTSVTGSGGVARPEPQAKENGVEPTGAEMSGVDETVHGLLLSLIDLGDFSTLAMVTSVKRSGNRLTVQWSEGAWSRDPNGTRYSEGNKLKLYKKIHQKLGDKVSDGSE